MTVSRREFDSGMIVEIVGEDVFFYAEAVYVGDDRYEELYDSPVLDLRIRRDEPDESWPADQKYKTVVEVKIKCSHCRTINWILLGTEPGEYRCSNCTAWL